MRGSHLEKLCKVNTMMLSLHAVLLLRDPKHVIVHAKLNIWFKQTTVYKYHSKLAFCTNKCVFVKFCY